MSTPDPTAPTFEEAKRCPRCGLPGEATGARAATNSRNQQCMVHSIYCRNEACRWFNTPWIVQTNLDGSIPPPITHKRGDIEKVFPARSFDDSIAERVEQQLQRQSQAEMRGGAEINNPNSPR